MRKVIMLAALLCLAATGARAQMLCNGCGIGYWQSVASGGAGTFLPLTGGTLTGPLQLPNGSAAAPSLAIGAANYGMYGGSPGLYWSVGGSLSYGMYGDSFWGYASDTRDLGDRANALFWKSLFLTRSIQGSKSKALTDATATAFVRVAIPQTIATNYKGGVVIYEVYCDDDTNQASQSGRVAFTCHNRAGTEACGFGTPDGVTLGDGTANLAAPTFDAATGAADTIDLRVTSDCTGITPNTHTFEWRLDMPTTATITPQ